MGGGGGKNLDCARTGIGKETPWFAGNEEEEDDEKQHKEKNNDNAPWYRHRHRSLSPVRKQICLALGFSREGRFEMVATPTLL